MQCHLPDFVLGNLQHSCICSELTKEAFSQSRCFLACPKTTVAYCRFPKINLYSKHGFRTDKRGLLGGVVQVLFGLPKDYSSVLPISQDKLVQYTWVPSSRRHKWAPATAARTPSRYHHRPLDTNSAIFMTLAWDLKRDEDWFSVPSTTDPL